MAKHQLIIKGKRIAYHLHGHGKPVILLHGFGEDHHVWRNQVDFFSDRYKLVIPDLPGSGESQLQVDMSITAMADVVKMILEEALQNDEPVYVIGHSMGGYVALAYAEKYPAQVTGLGLFHSTAFADSAEKIKTRQKGISFIQKNGALAFLKTSLPDLFSSYTKKENKALVEQLIKRAGNFSADALVSYYEAMMNRPDRSHLLVDCHYPVLFMISENDVAIPLADSLKQSILPLMSYITILKKSGHMGMLEEPAASNLALSQFLENSS